jgi:molybdate-binding protein/DNA-binding XRE family transcriptional regulator
MPADNERVVSHLKAARKAKGWSQSELAARVGVKRQAIYDMETGKYVPNTALALRMGRELGCRVEDLFSFDGPETAQPVTLAEKAGGVNTRVSLARVRDRLIAYPVDGKWLLNEGFQAADALLSSDSGHVQFFQKDLHVDKKVLLLGCDPAFAILGAHASQWAVEAKVQCRFASSHLALERLKGGYAHIAGTHLHDSPVGDSNVTLARKFLSDSGAIVVGFSFFEEGLMVAQGNPHGIRTVSDLAAETVSIVNREPGAALRILFDELLERAGLTGECVKGYDHLVVSHNQGAQLVALRLADAALGLRAVAVAHGLDFVPLDAVRCDLVIPRDFLDLPAVRVLLDVLQTRSLREELASLPGYESTHTGQIVGHV